MDLIDIFRTFPPKADYTFSCAHGTFSGVDHILGHKSNLINLRKLRSYQASSQTTTLRLDINSKKKSARNTNTSRLKNTFLNNQQVAADIKQEIKKF